jgi:tRNA threonylcarbamoyladenosine biosynthesis protein TsaE
MRTIETHSESETVALGVEFAQVLTRGDIVALIGELGTGKTRFVQGVCEGMGIREHVASPTFTIVDEYTSGQIPVYHFDFYRLRTAAELREIGFDEYLAGDGVCLIEWADRVQDHLPARRYDVVFTLGTDESSRRIEVRSPLEVTA